MRESSARIEIDRYVLKWVGASLRLSVATCVQESATFFFFVEDIVALAEGRFEVFVSVFFSSARRRCVRVEEPNAVSSERPSRKIF